MRIHTSVLIGLTIAIGFLPSRVIAAEGETTGAGVMGVAAPTLISVAMKLQKVRRQRVCQRTYRAVSEATSQAEELESREFRFASLRARQLADSKATRGEMSATAVWSLTSKPQFEAQQIQALKSPTGSTEAYVGYRNEDGKIVIDLWAVPDDKLESFGVQQLGILKTFMMRDGGPKSVEISIRREDSRAHRFFSSQGGKLKAAPPSLPGLRTKPSNPEIMTYVFEPQEVTPTYDLSSVP